MGDAVRSMKVFPGHRADAPVPSEPKMIDFTFRKVDDWNMKTTIDIPEDALREAMAHSRAATKKDAVLEAIDDYNRRKRAERAVASFGTFKQFMTPSQHRKNRRSRHVRHEKQRNAPRR